MAPVLLTLRAQCARCHCTCAPMAAHRLHRLRRLHRIRPRQLQLAVPRQSLPPLLPCLRSLRARQLPSRTLPPRLPHMPTHPRMTHKQARSRTVPHFVCCFDACSSCSVRFSNRPCVRLIGLPATRAPAGNSHLHCHHQHSIEPSVLYIWRCTLWCGVVLCVCLAFVDCAGHTPFGWVSAWPTPLPLCPFARCPLRPA
jgi:hypothetical protein